MRVSAAMPKPQRRPRLLVFGGGIGSGKTTLRDWLLRQRTWQDFNQSALVDTDQIRSRLRVEAEASAGKSLELEDLHRKASRLAEARLNRLLRAGVDIVWESTLGWEPDADYAAGALEQLYLRRFRANGYRVFLHGVTCAHALAEERFHLRALRENREVSDHRRLAGSHRRFEANVRRIARAVDHFQLWRSEASGFRRIAEWAGTRIRMPITPRFIDPPLGLPPR